MFPDGIFRLVRDNWLEFAYIYNVMDNRALTIHTVAVSAKTLNQLEDTFNTHYLIQEKHVQNLRSIREDIAILKNLLSRSRTMLLAGKGYFSEFRQDDTFLQLKDSIKQHFGNSYLSLLQGRLEQIQELPQYNLHENTLSPTMYANHSNMFFSHRYLDYYYLDLSYRIIQQGQSLKPQSYFATDVAAGSQQLSLQQKNRLLYIKSMLENEILHLLQHPEGSGRSLLIALARYAAMHKSIADNRLYILKCSSTESFLLTSRLDQAVISEIARDAYAINARITRMFFSQKNPTSFDLHLLEDSANRNYDLINGMENSIPIRITYNKLLPLKEEEIKLVKWDIPEDILYSTLQARQITEKAYHKKLLKIYSYDLWKKNCVTELFRTIGESVKNDPEISRREYGGYISATNPYLFIPAISAKKVKKTFNVSSSKNIESYRVFRLKKMKQEKNKFLVSLLESNTLTSRIYRFNADDSFFVFFTDNQKFLRPLYGIINFVSGLGQTIAGIITSPFDKGRRFVRGVKGMLFSLPEIFFFNIRKGTFLHVKMEDLPDYLKKDMEE